MKLIVALLSFLLAGCIYKTTNKIKIINIPSKDYNDGVRDQKAIFDSAISALDDSLNKIEFRQVMELPSGVSEFMNAQERNRFEISDLIHTFIRPYKYQKFIDSLKNSNKK